MTGLADDQFRALLDLWMRSDPADDKPRGAEEHLIEELLDEEADRRGYDGWVEAYHEHQAPEPEEPA